MGALGIVLAVRRGGVGGGTQGVDIVGQAAGDERRTRLGMQDVPGFALLVVAVEAHTGERAGLSRPVACMGY